MDAVWPEATVATLAASAGWLAAYISTHTHTHKLDSFFVIKVNLACAMIAPMIFTSASTDLIDTVYTERTGT